MIRRRYLSVLAVVLLVTAAGSLVAGQARRVPRADERAPLASDPFFDDSVLHEIRLTINSRDWQSLKDHYLDNTYYPADFKWKTTTVRNIGIRSRGTGSRSGTKPGLRVDFDRYVTDQKFLGLKSFVLRNQTQDPSNLHERLSMLLFKRMQAPAPREAHTKLYVNNQYEGLFTIVESIDKLFLQNTFGADDGYLYKYDYPADQPPYYFENKGDDPGLYVPLPFKPETHETDSRPEFIVQLVQAINDSSDATFRSAVGEYLDIDQFLRHVAIEMVVADDDAFLGNWGMNNFYVHRFTNGKHFRFIAWDKSNAFLEGYTFSIWHNIDYPDPAKRNRLMTRLLAYSDLKQRYLDFVSDAVKSATELEEGKTDGPGWLEREIQREYAQIRDAARADPDKPFTNEEFEKGIEDLVEFARHRAEFVNGEIDAARPH